MTLEIQFFLHLLLHTIPVQVSETTYQNNGGTPLDGGFNIDYGESGFFVPESIGTYYYVCQPHLPE